MDVFVVMRVVERTVLMGAFVVVMMMMVVVVTRLLVMSHHDVPDAVQPHVLQETL